MADELVTVDACVQLVMAIMGWVKIWIEVVDGIHAGQSQGGWSHVKSCRSTSRLRGDALTTPNHTAV